MTGARLLTINTHLPSIFLEPNMLTLGFAYSGDPPPIKSFNHPYLTLRRAEFAIRRDRVTKGGFAGRTSNTTDC
jgi:hypothetical protein